MQPETIHIRLLDEGTDVWRPTTGRRLRPMVFEVLATPGYDANDETWEFEPGALVHCEERTLSGHRVKVAVRPYAGDG